MSLKRESSALEIVRAETDGRATRPIGAAIPVTPRVATGGDRSASRRLQSESPAMSGQDQREFALAAR
ncbi:MAG: hypothetical protein F4X97_13760 [Boseongicola sp. SB0662_bin_57]|nr:hypothetical protein [Boseongicola sp. SB0662_bin_57]